MNTIFYIRLLQRKLAWFILFPLICAATVYFLIKDTPKEYISATTMYTGVASGYSITDDGDTRVDYFAVNNAFDNLLASAKSRETLEKVSLHLLAEHLALSKPDSNILGEKGFTALQKLISPVLKAKAKQLKDSASLFNYLMSLYTSKENNEISEILNKTGSFYSIQDMRSNLTASRLNTSDVLQVVYTCTDPAVCQRTLELHSDIFIAGYKGLKFDQTNSAVAYFEARLAEVKAKLEKSEDDLRDFGQKNRIVNYYEQTRYIAEQQQELEKTIYEEKAEKSGTEEALKLIESKLNSREKQIINSLGIIKLRQRLSDVNADLEKAKVYANADKIAELTAKSKAIEDSIKDASNTYMKLSYTTETVPRTDLITQWVDNAVAYDKSAAGLDVLTSQRQNYLDEFDEYAPLGSTLKRLDRQVDINAQEFLSVLHGLNLARLRQSSLSLSSNLSVLDKPFFPLEPQSSKTLLIVIVAFIAALILVAAVVFGRVWLNSSLLIPERAKKIIGLPVAGASLAVNKKTKNYLPISNILAEQFLNILVPYINDAKELNDAAQISFITIKGNPYQKEDLQLLHENLTKIYKEIFWIVPEAYATDFASAIPQYAFEIYKPGVHLLDAKDCSNITSKDVSQYALLLFISPNLSENGLPLFITKRSCANVLACNANDNWTSADKEILNKIRHSITDIPFFIWLTKTAEENMEYVASGLRKKGWLEKLFKRNK